jgi:hypothetical protein
MADAIPTLSISTEKICFVVLKSREFDVKDADTSSDENGSNPADDRMVEVLENRPDDPVDQELVAFIEASNLANKTRKALVCASRVGEGRKSPWLGVAGRAIYQRRR